MLCDERRRRRRRKGMVEVRFCFESCFLQQQTATIIMAEWMFFWAKRRSSNSRKILVDSRRLCSVVTYSIPKWGEKNKNKNKRAGLDHQVFFCKIHFSLILTEFFPLAVFFCFVSDAVDADDIFFRHFTSSVCMLCSNVRMYVCFFGWASFSLLIMFVKKRLNWNKIQTNNNNKVHCVCFFLSEWIIFRYLFQQQQ